MPIDIGNLRDIINSINSDVQNEIPGLDPSQQGSAIKAITQTFGIVSFDTRQKIAQLIQQFFPQTATDEFLELWADYDGLVRNPATPATGFLTAVGTIIGATIPVGTLLNSSSDVILETQVIATIQNISTNVVSITRSGSIVTVTTTADHKLATGAVATIAGADQSEYNGDFTVSVVSNLIFTYIIVGAPVTPATGTISTNFNGTELEVETQQQGLNQNVAAGSEATFSSPIAGVDVTALVRFPGIEGGTDIESDDDLRTRTLESRATINSLFSSDFLIERAKTVSGVTRVFVKEIFPGIGDTTVYFMRDGDPNPIPSGIDIVNVNTVLQAIRPANMQESDFDVLAPVAVTVGVTLSNLNPDTTTMRENINAVLVEFFKTQITFEQDVLKSRIEAALFTAQDTDTGQFLKTITIGTPASDVTVGLGKIGTLGIVTIL